jgi:pimeloyl-ACP methyl ester carboxylesterase
MPVDHIKAELTALAKEKERMIVLCGHSLGGGNAELCGLELLKEEFPVSAIVAHGAPQVIQPDPSNLLWLKMSTITTVYVNNFDVVPRLPSCSKEWKNAILGSMQSKTGSVVHSERFTEWLKFWDILDTMKAFRHIGTVVFLSIAKSKVKCFPVRASDIECWNLLRLPPSRFGIFIVQTHHSEYEQVFNTLLEQDICNSLCFFFPIPLDWWSVLATKEAKGLP